MARRGQVDGLEPIAGHYLVRLAAAREPGAPRPDGRTPPSPVKLWHGPPLDPETGEPLDRAPRWQALVNGQPTTVDRVWPWCATAPIDEAEYHYRLALFRHAVNHEPDLPQAIPDKPVDWLRAPPPVFTKRRRR